MIIAQKRLANESPDANDNLETAVAGLHDPTVNCKTDHTVSFVYSNTSFAPAGETAIAHETKH